MFPKQFKELGFFFQSCIATLHSKNCFLIICKIYQEQILDMCCHPFFQEKACAKCDEDIIDNLCIIFDLNDFSTSNMDYQFVKNLIWLLSRHYPERLGICLIINAPVLFYGCWTVIKPWSCLVSSTYLLILLLIILVAALITT